MLQMMGTKSSGRYSPNFNEACYLVHMNLITTTCILSWQLKNAHYLIHQAVIKFLQEVSHHFTFSKFLLISWKKLILLQAILDYIYFPTILIMAK